MTRGYYSLIQYCPDPARMEAANIGVFLYCPDMRYFATRFSRNCKRVRQFFGKKSVGAVVLDRLRSNIKARLERAVSGFEGIEGLREFIAREGNEILMTDPRPVAVTVPGLVLTDLFEQLVERSSHKKHLGLRDRLDEEFRKPEFDDIIAREVIVPVPVFGEMTLTIPFGYMNGRVHDRCNLIQPVTFPHDSGGDLVQRTGRIQLESEFIQQANMQLVVVGEFPEGRREIANRVAALIRQRGAEFYLADEMQRLIETIRKTAKPWPGRVGVQSH